MKTVNWRWTQCLYIQQTNIINNLIILLSLFSIELVILPSSFLPKVRGVEMSCVFTHFSLDPGLWTGKTHGNRDDGLRGDTLVQSPRGHLELDALHSDRWPLTPWLRPAHRVKEFKVTRRVVSFLGICHSRVYLAIIDVRLVL